jgi:hypothetical protein
MTTTKNKLSLRDIYTRQPNIQRALGRAIAFRIAARWTVPDSVHPYTRDSFRTMMRYAARDAVIQAKYIALKGGAL